MLRDATASGSYAVSGDGAQSGQPVAAYELAEFLATRFDAKTIINIVLASDHASMGSQALDASVRDCGLRSSSRDWKGKWIVIEWNASQLELDAEATNESIIVCSNLLECVPEPRYFLTVLLQLSRRSRAVIIATRDRDSTQNQQAKVLSNHHLPAAKWNLSEFQHLLTEINAVPTFIGLTTKHHERAENRAVIAILDRCPLADGHAAATHFSPLAILATYNDVDIALPIVTKLLDDGIDAHVLDNWSIDGTFEQLVAVAAHRRGLSVERFPAHGATPYYEWTAILRRKEAIAAKYPGRWIIHNDSDEVLHSPWANISLRGGLWIAQGMGFTAVDFTVCNFRPVDDVFSAGMDPERHIEHFEFDVHPSCLIQVRAWRQGPDGVCLAASGGHEPHFSGRRIFPYKFLMKHYPLRNSQQARRKVFVDRLGRYHPDEKKSGWHNHYDHCRHGDPFVWNASELVRFDDARTRCVYLTELISGIGIARCSPHSFSAAISEQSSRGDQIAGDVMKTIVLQSFRTRDVPDWITRCLNSVRAWAERSGHDYRFVDDRIFELCGSEYLKRVGDNKRSITNLARLELVQESLCNGYDRAIWFDADIFVFAPAELSIDLTARYAFSKEAWISVEPSGQIVCERAVNNAAFVFMKGEPDLGFLISAIRHIVANRNITSNYQMGVWLLTGLERSLNYSLLPSVGMLSPHVLRAIVDEDATVLQRQAIEFCDPMFAANLCLALVHDNPEALIRAAMDKLETTSGGILNQYASNNASPVAGYWSRSPQPSPFPCMDAEVQAAELRSRLDAIRNEAAEAHALLASARVVADQLSAENQSFRRSRVLRLWRRVRRVR